MYSVPTLRVQYYRSPATYRKDMENNSESDLFCVNLFAISVVRRYSESFLVNESASVDSSFMTNNRAVVSGNPKILV